MDLGLSLLLMSTVPPAFLSLRVCPTAGEQQPAVAQLTTGLGWLCHLTIFRPTLLLLKTSYHLPERGQLRAVFGLLTQADGRESMVVQQRDFCCRLDSSKDTWVRPVAHPNTMQLSKVPCPILGLAAAHSPSCCQVLWLSTL